MSRGASRRLTAAIAVLAGMGYGALALGSGLDRISLGKPETAARVPAPFASQALRSQGAVLIGQGQARAALAKGEAAVRDAPLDPGSTALLGIARFRLGDGPGAERAFRIAGQLGWREQFTQTYWMGRALDAGDWRVAAMRLDALLRQSPALLTERRLLDPIETSPAGRAALAERIIAAPGWLRPYTSALAEVPRPVLLLRAQVLGEVAARKGLLGCEAVAPLVERMVSESAELEAAMLWRQHCPGAASAPVYDGQFAAASLQQDRNQFAWTFIGQSDAQLLLEPAGNGPGRQLLIETTAAKPRQIARQMLLIAPGNYRLSWRAESPEGGPSDLVAAALSCRQVPAETLTARFDRAAGRWIAPLTVGGDCKVHWLSFGVTGRSGTVRLGEIKLEPAGQTSAPR
jgi:hypothetical protein